MSSEIQRIIFSAGAKVLVQGQPYKQKSGDFSLKKRLPDQFPVLKQH
jgi:hypothetical protein